VAISFVGAIWTLATLVAGYFLVRSRDPVVLAGLACSAPFISNLRFGQVSIFIVLLAMIDCLDLPPPKWRGVALGLAAAVKLTPLVFVPYLWLTGRRRAAVTSLVVFASSVLVSAAVLPRDTWRWLTREAWNTDRIGNLAQYGNQSVNGALLRLGDVPRWVPALICLVVLVVAYLRARRLDPMTGFVVVGAAGLAVSPVSWTHHQFVLYLAVVPLLAARRWIAAAAVATIMIVPLDLFVAIGWRDVRVWFAVLLVLTLGYPVPPISRARDWIAQRRSGAGEQPQRPTGSGVV
jgi:alpha-1,2-mannosyltransferase